MANNNELVDVVSSSAKKQIDDLLSGLSKVQTSINGINSSKISLPSQGRANSNNTAAANTAINKSMTEQQRLIMRISDAQKREAIETAKLRVELSNLNAENKKAAVEGLGLMNTYQKLSAELNNVRLEAKGLAADMFLLEQAGEQNTQQYKDLSNTYSQLASRTNLLDTGLKKIDANVGQYQRSVGNYASGWNGLGNAINQLTREAPAFAVSLSTGFLAISNNLPILSDEIATLVARNKELAASGQPTVSVLKQLATALFSWQTALSVGVTILTLYGKEIVTWVGNLFKAEKALNSLADSQKILSKAREESKKSIIEEKTTIGLYLQTARDTSKSDQERSIAVNKLRKEYEFYFGKLSEGEILLGKTKKAEDAVNAALEARSNSLAIAEKYNSSQKALVDINITMAKQQKIVNTEQQRQISIRKAAREGTISAAAATDQLLESYSKENANRAALTENIKRQNYQESVSNNLIKEAIKYKKDSIGLEYQPDQEKQTKKQIEALVDFQASEFALRQTRLENESKFQRDIVENEENGYADREAAASKYSSLQLQISENNRIENLRLIQKGVSDEIDALNKRVVDEEITRKNANDVIASIQKQAEFDSLKAYEDYSQEIKDISSDVEKSLSGVWSGLTEQERANKQMQLSIDNARQLGLLLGGIGNDSGIKEFAALENKIRALNDLEQDQKDQGLRDDKIAIQNDIQRLVNQGKSVENNAAINSLKAQELNIDKQLTDSANKRKEAIEGVRIAAKQATTDYLSTFTNNVFENSGLTSFGKLFDQVTYDVIENINGIDTIVTKTGSSFDKMFDQASGTAQKTAVVFQTMTSVIGEAVNFLQQNQQAAFDKELTDAQNLFEIRKKYAGDSAVAQAELEQELEDKKRDIRIREAKAAKAAAIFNIALSTAQGIVSALALVPPNIPLSITIGAIGLAQGIAVASRPLPAYKYGTDFHKGGAAIVGDGGKNEVIWQPKSGYSISPNKDTIMNLERGSKVYPDIASSGLLSSGLSAMKVPSKGLTEEQMDRIMSRHLANSSSFNLTFDERGYTKHQQKGNAKTISHNNRVSFKGNAIRG